MDERIGIAGSGTIACGLAATAALHGPVLLWARSDSSAERAQGSVQKLCAKVSDNGTISKNVRIVTDMDDLAEATFLVEAVIEHQGLKTGVLADLGELARHAAADAIVATTTSSLSVTELAMASGHPERFVGFHVFNPVPRMKLVELAFPDAATEETRQRARALCEKLDKIPVEVPDIPGFVVNRLLFPYLFSAVELMESQGMTPKAVDQCMQLGAGMPMGPIALLDFVGLDVSAAIGDEIGADVPERMRQLVEEGACGRKVGRGFYDYSKN